MRSNVLPRIGRSRALTLVTVVACVLFVVSTVPGVRAHQGYSTLWDGGVEATAWGLIAVLCVYRGWRCSARLGWMVIAAGIVVEAIGQGSWYWVVQTLDPVPYPSVADLFYLAFYPLTYVGFVLVLRPKATGVPISVWLDGVIVALSIAAIACGTILEPVLAISGGHFAEVATNLAYPIGDIALLGLTFGAMVVMGFRSRMLWLLALSMLGTAIGDVTYLLREAHDTFQPGTWIDALWTVALLVSALAARPTPAGSRRHDTGRLAAHGRGLALMALPMVLVLVDVALLDLRPGGFGGTTACGLASVAIIVGLGRLGVTLKEVRGLADSRRQAHTDDLTGLPNRRQFITTLTARVTDAATLAVLLIDLDRFKEINDCLGHHIGDQILTRLGERLAGVLESPQLLARLGGDEFGVILPETNAAEAVSVAHALLSAFHPSFELPGVSLHVDASIGVALFPDHARDTSGLLRHADMAMYKAKHDHSGYQFSDPAVDEATSQRLETVEALHTALESDQLVLHYQPKVELGTWTVTGVEALVRWQHPERGLLYPDSFIALAEQSGLMRRLTLVVLETALRQASQWRDEGRNLTVAVNLSASNLLDDRLPDQIELLLDALAIPAELLEVEVTETVLVADPIRADRVLRSLRQLGIRIAVDDYGTGYSSLSYLQDMPVTDLKLDRSFVMRATDDARSAAIVRSTVGLAHSLNMNIIAEGVETASALELLVETGYDLAQGYYLARPQPADQLTAWLDSPRNPDWPRTPTRREAVLDT